MEFPQRHIGPDEVELDKMLTTIDADSLSTLVDQTIPDSIRFEGMLALEPALSEVEVLAELRRIAESNQVVPGGLTTLKLLTSSTTMASFQLLLKTSRYSPLGLVTSVPLR